MRKINALILGLLFLGVSAFAQNGANEIKASSGARDLNYVKSNHIIKAENTPTQKKVAGYLYESFEGAFPPAGWSLLNLDGGTGWAQNTVGSLWPGWNTMTQTVPPGGGNKAVYATYGDVSGFDYQVLITPAFTVAVGDSLKYWLSRFGGYQDSVFVKISNTGSAIQDFDVTLLEVDSIDLVETIWKQYKHDLSAYAGQTIFVAFIERIADNLNNGAVISLDLVKLGTPYTTDAGVSAITNPTSGVGLGTESVTVTVNDYGTDNMVNVPLSYKIVGGSVVNQAYSGTINGGASNTFTFTTGANLSAGGNFTIKAWTSLPGDMDPTNDTTTITITNTLCALGNLLFDNGPIFNQTGTGPGGANFSFLQDSIESYGIKTGNGSYRCSDDLIVGSQGYIIDGFAFFTYQTGGPVSPSSVTSLDLRVWNGNPSNAASIVVWGDTTTNVLSCSFFSNVYRGDDVLMANRAIMKNVVLLSTPINLAVGEYWIDWRVNGSLASGPWQPPIFKTGTQTTGNGIQYSAGSWAPAYFNSTSVACQQGLPFLVYGVNGTGIQDIEADNLNVYPNPAKDQVTINSSSLVKEIKILNSLGQVILNQSVMNFNPTVNVSNISAGLYFIQIITEKGLSTKKININ